MNSELPLLYSPRERPASKNVQDTHGLPDTRDAKRLVRARTGCFIKTAALKTRIRRAGYRRGLERHRVRLNEMVQVGGIGPPSPQRVGGFTIRWVQPIRPSLALS